MNIPDPLCNGFICQSTELFYLDISSFPLNDQNDDRRHCLRHVKKVSGPENVGAKNILKPFEKVSVEDVKGSERHTECILAAQRHDLHDCTKMVIFY